MAGKQNLIFGINPILEKLRASPADIVEILLSNASDHAPLRRIYETAVQFHVPVTAVSPRFLDQLVNRHKHQGAVARLQPFRYLDLEQLLEHLAGAEQRGSILVLDGLTDPRNLGALLRTADGAGVHFVVIPKDRSAEVTALAIKASAGAAYHLKIVKVTNLRRAILELKKLDYWIIGLDADSPESIYDRRFPSPLAVVLGSEGRGVRPVILRECDLLVSIPMVGKVASLNVSVAGAVLLYELLRQKRSSEWGAGNR